MPLRTLQKLGLVLFTLTASLHLSSCSGITIKDSEWCGSLASKGADCWHLLTEDHRRMTLIEFAAWWNDLKDPKVATSYKTLAEWKGTIEKLCSDHQGACTIEMQEKVDQVAAKIEAAKSRPLPQKSVSPAEEVERLRSETGLHL